MDPKCAIHVQSSQKSQVNYYSCKQKPILFNHYQYFSSYVKKKMEARTFEKKAPCISE